MSTGQLACPKCGGPVKAMGSGKGWICVKAGKWNGKGWSGSCDGTVWNKAAPNKWQSFGQKIERAADWFTIRHLSDEQRNIDSILRQSPAARGSRALIVNAGPGCAKSSTMAHECRTIWQRVGDVSRWYIAAFNRNAKADLERKLPVSFPNVFTLNGLGGNLQGFKGQQYDENKLKNIWRDWMAAIPYKERPSTAGLFQFCERMRDQLCVTADPASPYWRDAINRMAERYPALAKKLKEHFYEFIPALILTSANQSGKIEIAEQCVRPVVEVITRTGWIAPLDWLAKGYIWSDDDVSHLATLIRSINRFSDVQGLIVDEAQDLSLAQICQVLAVSWRRGELVVVGDDYQANEQGELVKAGQGIFGWRGAFPGSMALISRLWTALTGETVQTAELSVTFRCPEVVVTAVKPLNTILRAASDKPGMAAACSFEQAWTAWANLPEGKTALWLSRTNQPLGLLFLESLKARLQVSLRSSAGGLAGLTTILGSCGGYCGKDGEYSVSLSGAIKKLEEDRAELAADGEAENDLELFVLEVMKAIQEDPKILEHAKLSPSATVGNVRRFLEYFADKSAPRTLSTVYRAKGDEASLVVICDVEKFNQAWNGDEIEASACRHVAATRASETLLVVGGGLLGVNVDPMPTDDGTT